MGSDVEAQTMRHDAWDDELETDLLPFVEALREDLRNMPPLLHFDLRDPGQAKEATQHYDDVRKWVDRRLRSIMFLKSQLMHQKWREGMSIEWLYELERAVDAGKGVFACLGVGKDQWQVARTAGELLPLARRAAASKRVPVPIVRLVPPTEAGVEDLFLVPVEIAAAGLAGEPQVRWSMIGSREAAEMMRDVRHGPSPFFAMHVEETIGPEQGPV